MNDSTLCILHISINITDFLREKEAVIRKETHHPVPEQLTQPGPKVFFCVNGGEKDLVEIYDDGTENRHFTFSDAIVSITVYGFNIEELLGIHL